MPRTNREYFSMVARGEVTAEVMEWATEQITRLDIIHRRKVDPTDIAGLHESNQECAKAILKALTKGKMKACDLAEGTPYTTVKICGVANQLEKLGLITRSKVKVKGKGEMSCFELRAD